MNLGLWIYDTLALFRAPGLHRTHRGEKARELEPALRREGLPRVGTTTIRRVLHDAGSSYQRTRTWCPTGTAQRKHKAGVVQVVDPKTEEKRGPSTWRTG